MLDARVLKVSDCMLSLFLYIYSYIWGTIADRKGRKPVIIVSVILVGLTSAIFGFSVSYEMAVITRFLVGLTNGELPKLCIHNIIMMVMYSHDRVYFSSSLSVMLFLCNMHAYIPSTLIALLSLGMQHAARIKA